MEREGGRNRQGKRREDMKRERERERGRESGREREGDVLSAAVGTSALMGCCPPAGRQVEWSFIIAMAPCQPTHTHIKTHSSIHTHTCTYTST